MLSCTERSYSKRKQMMEAILIFTHAYTHLDLHIFHVLSRPVFEVQCKKRKEKRKKKKLPLLVSTCVFSSCVHSCIYVTYVHVCAAIAVSVCRGAVLCAVFKWIFQRPTIPVPCVRGSFPRILAMTPSLPHCTAWQPAAPAAP